jgi:hypothetical protein
MTTTTPARTIHPLLITMTLMKPTTTLTLQGVYDIIGDDDDADGNRNDADAQPNVDNNEAADDNGDDTEDDGNGQPNVNNNHQPA